MIIAVSGKARSGKDTFSRMLAEELFDLTRVRFVMMAFAHGIKTRTQKDFDLSYEQLWGDEKETIDTRYPKPEKTEFTQSKFWSGREIMQAYGEFFRSIHPDFWVKDLFDVADEKGYKNIIITDVRHGNEVEAVRSRDGYLIKVESGREDMPKVFSNKHISETALDDFDEYDFTVSNNGGLDVLNQSAKDVANFLMKTEKLKNSIKDLEV